MSDFTKTYLALGDSYTSGTSIAFPVNFPNQLADSIHALTGKTIAVKIVAQNAWRTDDLQRAIKRSDLDETYDLVSLLIGVNNQYQGLPLADFERDFRRLLDTAITFSGNFLARISAEINSFILFPSLVLNQKLQIPIFRMLFVQLCSLA